MKRLIVVAILAALAFMTGSALADALPCAVRPYSAPYGATRVLTVTLSPDTRYGVYVHPIDNSLEGGMFNLDATADASGLLVYYFTPPFPTQGVWYVDVYYNPSATCANAVCLNPEKHPGSHSKKGRVAACTLEQTP